MTAPAEKPGIDIGGGYAIVDRTPQRRGAHTFELNNGHGLHSDEAKAWIADDRARWVRLAAATCPTMNQAAALKALQDLDFVASQDRDARGDAGGAGGAGDASGPTSDTESETQAVTLVRLAEGWALWHDPDHTPYASFEGAHGEHQTIALRSQSARLALQRAYYAEKGQVPRAQALQDAIGVLQGRAIFEGCAHRVFVRIASHEGALYLDLCDEQWHAVKVTAEGWEVVVSDAVPVKFRRAKGMLALPLPARGGSIDDLRPFVNSPDDAQWVLKVGWLVGAFRPHGPYAALALYGEQGSAKSTTARVLRALIDPNGAPLRAAPRDMHDLMIAATNGWLIALDNLSRVSDELSDALCRLATGGGASARQLYTDAEEAIFENVNPVLLNGIEEVVTKPDLLDRLVMTVQPVITDEGRRDEKGFWQDFEEARPRILGALLDAVAAALRNEPHVHLESKPRMADFAQWVTAAEPGLGWEPGTFLAAYATNRADAAGIALEASEIVPALRKFLQTVQQAQAEQDTWTWEGTATELLAALNSHADDDAKRSKAWPAQPHVLSGRLKRLAPSLRATGVSITLYKGPRPKQQRMVGIEWSQRAKGESTGKTASPASPCVKERPPSVPTAPSERPHSPHEASPPDAEASPLGSERPRFHTAGDAGDAGDASGPTLYASPSDDATSPTEDFEL